MAIEALSLAWLATILDTGADYAGLIAPFVLAGVGMALFFVPVASVALGSVPTEQEGLASGTNNAMRELGGVLGVAVLASVFAANGGYGSPAAFVDGTRPALWVGAAVLLTAAAVATLLPSPARTAAPVQARPAVSRPSSV
nr:hypothetical protein [Parafrankia discariae]